MEWRYQELTVDSYIYGRPSVVDFCIVSCYAYFNCADVISKMDLRKDIKSIIQKVQDFNLMLKEGIPECCKYTYFVQLLPDAS